MKKSSKDIRKGLNKIINREVEYENRTYKRYRDFHDWYKYLVTLNFAAELGIIDSKYLNKPKGG